MPRKSKVDADWVKDNNRHLLPSCVEARKEDGEIKISEVEDDKDDGLPKLHEPCNALVPCGSNIFDGGTLAKA